MADRTGQELGNYRLISLLGRGGFAEVYLGEHIRLKTKAAIKVLYTQVEGDDSDSFLQEAQTVAHLVHPHIVRIFDFDVKDNVPFLVMDYAPNGNLRQRHPKNTRLPLETVITYIKQVTEALQYAHDEKFIHRDIKPENMLLGRRNDVLLSDFGIALIAQSTRMQSTQEVVGTAYYMAPEQLQGKPRLASDQYSLGIVVYEWLTGSRPFQGSFSEIASQHMFVPPLPLREKDPSISPAVEEVVMTALAKDPYKRFGSVRAFANALEQAGKSARMPSRAISQDKPFEQAGSLKTLGQPAPAIIPQSQPLLQSELPPTTVPSGPITSGDQARSQPVPSSSFSQSGQPAHTDAPIQPSIAPVASLRMPNQAASPSISTTSQPSERRISRRGALIGLAGVAIVGGGLTWLVLSQQSSQSNTPGYSGPELAPAYSGTFNNAQGTNGTATLTLSSIVQNQNQVSGSFTISSPFSKAGEFTGSIVIPNSIMFTDAGNSLSFNGTIFPDDSIQGNWTTIPESGDEGAWSVSP